MSETWLSNDCAAPACRSRSAIRLAVIDDHPILLDGLCATFSAHGDFDVVGRGASHRDALTIAETVRPELMFIDIRMPGGGIQAAGRISADYADIKIVMLTASEAEDDLMSAFRSGALGYALKNSSGAELIAIAKTVARGQPYVPPNLAGRMLTDMSGPRREPAARPQEALRSLTFREDQILKLAAAGLRNKEIGEKLNIREKTVKHYMTCIFQKLDVRNRVEAVLMMAEARGDR
ncbi:MAG: response regulator transcription factor [Alphaproteobacteria bacterium]